jgi:hypothetical protein
VIHIDNWAFVSNTFPEFAERRKECLRSARGLIIALHLNLLLAFGAVTWFVGAGGISTFGIGDFLAIAAGIYWVVGVFLSFSKEIVGETEAAVRIHDHDSRERARKVDQEGGAR